MALSDRKIEAADIAGHRVVDRPDTASNQAETVKGWFDDLPVNFIIPAINDTIDDLAATTDGASGADQIGATPIISGGASTVQGILDELFARVYPIDSIYMSVSDANPSTLFGGTWVAWGTGRVPVGIDGTQTEFDTVEKTGGHKKMQKHKHVKATVKDSAGAADTNGAYWAGASGSFPITGDIFTGETGTGDSENLQPYITCYMWKRTA